MRFSRAAVVSVTALLATVDATGLNQYKQRSLVDICANVNAPLSILGTVFGTIQICICISTLPTFLQTHPVLQTAVARYGTASVTAAMNNMIGSSPSYKQCNYPDNCQPLCASTNPCSFTCTNGFFPSPIINPTTCSCPPPFTVCNGVCGIFLTCTSQKAKRDIAWRDTQCEHGWSACGVLGSSKLDYECVDVRNDLWSCGGCGIPLLPTDPTGQDCTAIPGVLDVKCAVSRCVVERCKKGYFVSDDKSTCLPENGRSLASPLFVENGHGNY